MNSTAKVRSVDARWSQGRLCFVAPFGMGAKSTVWARTLPLARQIASRGWSVRLVVPPWDTPTDAGRRWQDTGVEVINVTTRGGIAPTVARLLREIDRSVPDLVHIVKPRAYAGLAQWMLWQRHRLGLGHTPIVLDIDDWEQAWSSVNRYPRPLARFLAWQEEWGIRHADGITAASQWLTDRARRYSPGVPVLYLPNGISPTVRCGSKAQVDATDVLFFTRYVEITPDWLARFWQRLCEHKPKTRLILAGQSIYPDLERPFRAALAAVSTPPEAQISWLGYVPHPALPAIYARTGCAIFPAHPVPLQQAKCSVRLATTLLQGVPVVASAVGEQAAYGANDAALLVPADATPEVFAAAVVEVLENPELRRTLAAAAAHRLQQRFDWDLLGQRLFDFYAKLLEGRPGRDAAWMLE